jgi:hypothetical protein
MKLTTLKQFWSRRWPILLPIIASVLVALFVHFDSNSTRKPEQKINQTQNQTVIIHTEPPPQVQPQSPPQKRTKEMQVPSPGSKTTQLNAPNSVISIDQKGGITAGTVNLNVNLAPQARHITKEQDDKLQLSLRQLHGTKIVITSLFGDKEAASYAAEIETTLNKSGILLERNLIGSLMPPMYGLIISPDESMSPIRNAFKSAAINFTIEQIPGPSRSGIFVGLNPNK